MASADSGEETAAWPPTTDANKSALCIQCAPIRAELLFGYSINKRFGPRFWRGRELDDEGWYGPRIGEALANQESCALCAAIIKSLTRSQALEGNPDRRSRLTLVTPMGEVCDGQTPWDPYNPAGQLHEEKGYSTRLNNTQGFGVAGLSIDAESEPGSNKFPERASHGYKVVAPSDCTETVKRICTRREIGGEVGNRSFEIAAGWMKTCEDRHKMCRRTLGGVDIPVRGDTKLPTRVIDVREDKLVETGYIKGRYAALSYRWPQGEPVQLLKDNLEHFKRRLPLDRLPIALLQAIEATKRLGLPYLWIDALCIIQDDKADWAREAKLMYSVYQFAALTLALLGDTSAPQGFLHREKDTPWLRIPWFEPNEKIEGSGKESSSCSCSSFSNEDDNHGDGNEDGNDDYDDDDDDDDVSLAFSLPRRIPAVNNAEAAIDTKTALRGYFDVLGETTFGETDHLGRGSLRSEFEESEWSTRGWTYQERLMSSRVLYFGKRQLFWECASTTNSEDTHDNIGEDDWSSQGAFGIHSLHWAAQKQSGGFKTMWETMTDQGQQMLRDQEEEKPSRWNRAGIFATKVVSRNPVTKGYVNLVDKVEKLALRATQIDNIGWGGIKFDLLLREFTRRQLSYSKDRLIAFRGLGEVLATRSGQEYKAGLFTGKLAKNLFWCSSDGDMQTPLPYVAPTWSWGSRLGRIEMYSDRESSGYLQPDFGGLTGSLKKYGFLDKNDMMTLDSDKVACEPLSLEVKAMCLPLSRSSRSCSAFPRVMQQLRDDIVLWPDMYTPWPFERCHLLYASSPQSSGSSKKAMFTCPQCRGSFSSPSDVDANLHAEACNHSIPKASKVDNETSLAGVALFDDSAQPPASFVAVLLWDTSTTVVTVINKKTRLLTKEEIDAHERQLVDEARRPRALVTSSTTALNFSACPMRNLSLTDLSSRKKTYFVLLVQHCAGRGPEMHKRVGIGILYWVPGLDRFGGLDYARESKIHTISLL